MVHVTLRAPPRLYLYRKRLREPAPKLIVAPPSDYPAVRRKLRA